MTRYANADQTIGENAPLYHRQAQKDVLEKAFSAFSPEYVPYLKERVAPRQREHEMANTRLMDEVKRRSLNDQFHLATKEIDAASKTKGHEEAFALLKGMVERPEQLIDKFYNKFDKDVLNTIEDDRQEQWFRRIAPSLTGQSIERGTFGSPSYRRMMQKASNDYRIALDREKTKFKQDQFNESIRHAAAHTGQAANAASLGLANTMQERQSRMNLADQRMRTDASKSAQELALSSALSSEGATKQAQEQEKLNREYERYLEKQEHPLRMAERQAAIVAGAPQLGRDVRVAVASPSSPLNPLAASASTLASLAGAMRESAGKKKGGKIKHPLTYRKGGKVKKFAKGGDVNPYSLPDSENAAMNTPEMTELREMGAQKTKQRDPIAEYLMSMGATMAATHNEGPWASLGHGQRAGLEAKNKAMDTNDVNEARQAKLLEAIQNTRSKTQQLLADYQISREQLQNQKEVNASTINLHNAHADYYKAQTNAVPEKIENKGTKRFLYDREGKPYAPRTEATNKRMAEILNAVRDTSKGINLLTDAAIATANADTGPWKGWLTNPEKYINAKLPNIGKAIVQGTTGGLEELLEAQQKQEKYVGHSTNAGKLRTNMGLRQNQAQKMSVEAPMGVNRSNYKSSIDTEIETLDDLYQMSIIEGSDPEEREFIRKKLEEAQIRKILGEAAFEKGRNKNPKVKKISEQIEEILPQSEPQEFQQQEPESLDERAQIERNIEALTTERIILLAQQGAF